MITTSSSCYLHLVVCVRHTTTVCPLLSSSMIHSSPTCTTTTIFKKMASVNVYYNSPRMGRSQVTQTINGKLLHFQNKILYSPTNEEGIAIHLLYIKWKWAGIKAARRSHQSSASLAVPLCWYLILYFFWSSSVQKHTLCFSVAAAASSREPC